MLIHSWLYIQVLQHAHSQDVFSNVILPELMYLALVFSSPPKLHCAEGRRKYIADEIMSRLGDPSC